MTSLSVVRQRKAVWAILIALAFLAMSLPKINQAQTRDPLTGRVVQEVEVTETGTDNDDSPQFIGEPNVTVHGKMDGELVPTFLVAPIDIPPILGLDGNPVGVPRQTQIIVFFNAFTDVDDLSRFRLRRATNISINLATSGDGYQTISKDAVVNPGAFNLPLTFPDIVVPTDLDLFLFDSRGRFIDSSETGFGFLPVLLPCCFGNAQVETISRRALPTGQYIVDINNFNSFAVFLVAPTSPDQNVLTNELVYAWESAVSEPYILRIGVAPFTGGQPPESVQPPLSGVKFAGSYRPVRPINGAAQDYQIMDVTRAGHYTVNLAMKETGINNGGHLTLMRYDETTRRGTVVASSVPVENGLESLANVTLEPGRYVIAMQQNGLKPLTKRTNYFISVLDENGEMIGLQSSQLINLDDIRAGFQHVIDEYRNTTGDGNPKPSDDDSDDGGR